MKRITQRVYKLRLEYDPSASYVLKDSTTHVATIDLYIKHKIECAQCACDELLFDSDSSRMLAVLVLSSTNNYTVQVL